MRSSKADLLASVPEAEEAKILESLTASQHEELLWD